MDIVRLKCSQLLVNEGQVEGLPTNPRSWTKADIEKLARSLEETPELFEARPCIVYPYGDKYIVLGGNMRLTAAKTLKYKDVPCIVIPAETTIDKLKEIVIKDNGAFGAWDFDELANKWDDLPLTDWGVPAWEEKHLEETEQEATEDDFDETADQVETRCQKGDIWKLGEHRLMCGDSTSETDVAELMDGELADMCFTDPPYGVSYAEKNEFLNALGEGHRLTKRIENDSESPAQMHDFWLKVFGLIGEFTKDCMAYYITAPQGGDLLLLQAIQESDVLQLKHMLIWNKNNHVLGRCDYNYKHEPIIYGWKKNGTHHFVGGSKFKTSVWDIPKPLKSDLHPTMKPVELVGACIQDNSTAGQSVLDLFGGSGTTMIAAEQLGRKCYMMELDPYYCDVIIARWEKLTGKTAEKV